MELVGAPGHTTGPSRSAIARLLTFGNLPKAALEAIAQTPGKITGLLAEELAGLSTSHEARVSEAISLVIAGELVPTKAHAWVLDVNPVDKPKAQETIIRKGKYTYAKVVRRGGQVNIAFANPLDADEAEKALIEFINQ